MHKIQATTSYWLYLNHQKILLSVDIYTSRRIFSLLHCTWMRRVRILFCGRIDVTVSMRFLIWSYHERSWTQINDVGTAVMLWMKEWMTHVTTHVRVALYKHEYTNMNTIHCVFKWFSIGCAAFAFFPFYSRTLWSSPLLLCLTSYSPIPMRLFCYNELGMHTSILVNATCVWLCYAVFGSVWFDGS